MDITAVVKNVASLAALASTVTRQTQFGSAIAMAQAGVELVDELRALGNLDANQVATLETSREMFEAAVNAHADRTADSLGEQ